MTTVMDRELFAARARETGVPLTEGEIDHLFEGYGLLQRLIAEFDRPTDVELEPAFVFKLVSYP
jgi:hypothetical protein